MALILRPTVLAFVALAILFCAIILARMPPALQSAGEYSAEVFNGAAAVEILERLLPENKPHPAGSEQNKAMRDRILAELRDLGLQAEVQTAFSCSSIYPACGPVENIVAIHRGQVGRRALAFVAHYDSKIGAPGAADDLAAVAVMLELARHVTSGPDVANDIAFVFTDAEENGLLGAEAFAQSHPLTSDIGLMVNMEARGASGRAVLFETQASNASLMSQLRPMMMHPTGTSLFHAVYKMLPNDTDYSVFRARDVPGINFAFTGSPSLYHSARDDLVHLDKGSLQHHGQNALDILIGFGNSDLEFADDEDAVFFDLFGDVLITWPMSWTWGMLGLMTLLLAAASVRLFADGQISAPGIALGGALWIGAVLLALAGGYLLSFPIGVWAQVTGIDHANPWGARLSLVFTAFAIGAILGRFVLLRVQALELGIAVWLLWLAISVVLQIFLPGGVFLFLVPGLVFAPFLLAVACAPKLSANWCFALSLLAVSYFGLSAAIDLETVVNFNLAYVHMVPLVMVICSVMIIVRSDAGGPVFVLPLASLAALVSVISAFLSSSVSPERPVGMSVVQYQNLDTSEAFILVEDSPFFPVEDPAFRGFEVEADWRFAWGSARRGRSYRSQRDGAPEAANVQAMVISNEAASSGRQVSLLIVPDPDVVAVTLYVPADRVRGVEAERHAMVLGRRGATPESGSLIPLRFNGLYGREISLLLKVDGAEGVTAFLSSMRPGVSRKAALIANARPEIAAPVHEGDLLLQSQTFGF